MRKVPLGRSGLTVSPVCFGGNVFGWTLDREASFGMLDRCLDAGLNFVDSADAYSYWIPGNKGGESETLIGEWMADRKARERMVIATKVGIDISTGKPNLKPAYIAKAVDASLKRLKTDYIDLYYAHRDDTTLPMAEVLGAFGDLVQAGKVRALGASNFTAERLSEAMTVRAQSGGGRYDVLQPEYNLYDRGFEQSLQQACARHGIAVAPFFALGSGFLSGKYRSTADADKSPRGAGVVKRYLNPKGERVLAAMDQVAQETGANLSQIAIAWLIRKPTVVSAIASATTESQFRDLVAAATLDLTAEQMARLDQGGA
jgi:aryl-alcohol dehydrogenase-like predicted oxidoreductase